MHACKRCISRKGESLYLCRERERELEVANCSNRVGSEGILIEVEGGGGIGITEYRLYSKRIRAQNLHLH